MKRLFKTLLSGAVHGSLMSAPESCAPATGCGAVRGLSSVARDCLCLFIATHIVIAIFNNVIAYRGFS